MFITGHGEGCGGGTKGLLFYDVLIYINIYIIIFQETYRFWEAPDGRYSNPLCFPKNHDPKKIYAAYTTKEPFLSMCFLISTGKH